MATFMDMLNQGLGNLNTPIGQLGTQLMMASGPQAGDPSAGARMGQALVGMQQQQAQQQQMQQQAMLRQIQQQELGVRVQDMMRKEKAQQGIASALQNNPEAFGSMSPMARQLIQAGASPDMIADLNKMVPQPKQPTPPGMYDMPQPDNTVVRNVWNPQTGKYEQSAPFTPTAQQAVDVTKSKAELEAQYKPLEYQLQAGSAAATQQNAETAAQRAQTALLKEQREKDAATMKSKFDRLEFKNAYRGASNQLEEVASLAEGIAKDPALPSLYGPNGYIPPIAGSDAADLQARINQLKAKGGLAELVKLKNNGVALTPVSNTDLEQAQMSFANMDKLQSDAQAREVFAGVAGAMRKARDEAATRFNEYDSLYSDSGAQKDQGPARIADDSGYNALPSGATFVGPDGVLRRKP